MFKFIKYLFPVFFFFLFFSKVSAEEKINLYFFYGDGCPHCAKEEIFLDKLEKEKDNIKIFRYETWHNQENAKLLGTVANKLNTQASGVPFLVIGAKNVVGFYNEETTGKKIREIIEDYEINGCSDVMDLLKVKEKDCVHGDTCTGDCQHDCGCAKDVKKSEEELNNITIPLVGEIDIKQFSLPLLTIIVAGIDGFNPCAMWILLFLISLLLGMKDRKKMFILGFAFISASAFVYFLFLAAWLKLFIFLGFVFWIRLFIAIVALVAGIYHLYDFYQNKNGGCKVTDGEKRKRIFDKLKNIVQESNFYIAIVGVIILAVAVNLVELVCSAGLPAVYTQVLSLSKLSTWQYYGYLILYIFIFMLDDLLIFFIAMKTLEMKSIDSRYTRYAGLIGGLVMILIGILLIFKPGLLMFG